MKKSRAFLKWAEGKYPLLNDAKRHLSRSKCLIEPFVGVGSVFPNTDFSRYILADISSDLISLHNVVKTHTDEYVQVSCELFMPETNQAEAYYRFKEESNAGEDPFCRTVLFLHLNHFGYNGLRRYNLRDKFNIPFRRYKKPYFSGAELYHFVEKARNAELHCLSYEERMNRADGSSVAYCGPPYAPLLTTTDFTAYHTNSFSPKKQVHLAGMAEELVSKQIPVSISNHDTPNTREQYRAAKHLQVKMRRNTSSNGGMCKEVNELLVLYKPGVVTPVKK